MDRNVIKNICYKYYPFREDFFLKSSRKFIKFLDKININMERTYSEKPIGIVVCPWSGTAVSWFAITIGIMLKHKYDKDVVFIFNDLWNEIGKKNNKYSMYSYWTRLISKVFKHIENADIIYLSKEENDFFDKQDYLNIEKLVKLNTIKQNSSYYIYDKNDALDSEWKMIIELFYSKARVYLKKHLIESCIVPGGLYAIGGVFYELCCNNRINVLTYDGGNNSLLLDWNDIASHRMFTHKSINLEWVQNHKDEIKLKVMDRLQRRMDAKKETSGVIIQNSPFDIQEIDGIDILILPNVEKDTAALGCHDLFSNDWEWISETIKYIIENTDHSLVIREHPMEYMVGGESIYAKIKNKYENERVHIFLYSDIINTYSLIKKARLVIVHTSTVGLEAAIMKKNVMTPSKSFYSSSTFIYKPQTKKEYFKYIKNLDGIEKSEDKSSEIACLYYFLADCLGIINTYFTAIPHDFEKWSKLGLIELEQDKMVQIILEMIVKKENVIEVLCQHRDLDLLDLR